MNFVFGNWDDDTTVIPTCTGRNREIVELLRDASIALVTKGDELTGCIDGG